jgi:hypothetical protein
MSGRPSTLVTSRPNVTLDRRFQHSVSDRMEIACDSSYMATTLATVVARRYGQKSHKLSTNGHAPISSARSVGSVHGAADYDRDSRVVQQVESYGTQHGAGQKPRGPGCR